MSFLPLRRDERFDAARILHPRRGFAPSEVGPGRVAGRVQEVAQPLHGAALAAAVAVVRRRQEVLEGKSAAGRGAVVERARADFFFNSIRFAQPD